MKKTPDHLHAGFSVSSFPWLKNIKRTKKIFNKPEQRGHKKTASKD